MAPGRFSVNRDDLGRSYTGPTPGPHFINPAAPALAGRQGLNNNTAENHRDNSNNTDDRT
jgi:hypothetical protein